MANGCYQIQIGVTSSGGGVTTAVSSVVVAGEMKLGDYATTYKDLSTTIAGFPIDVTRTYDTTDSRRGDFGVGWRVDLSSFRVTPNNRLGQGGWSTQPFGFPFTRYRFVSSKSHFVTVTEPGGRVEVFDFVPDPSGPLLTLTLPGFVARPGTGTTSTLQDVDSPTLSLAGDSMASFFGGELYDPRLFRLTTADGNVLIIDRFNGLQSITDRNGNQLLVDGTGIHSPSTSRQLTFTRDGAGRITSIDAPGGKHTSYTYSAAGDLSTFTDAGGNVDKFTYNGAHRLLAVDGPNNTRLRTLTYGPDGRFTSLTDAAGNTMSLSSNVDTRSEVVTSPSGRLTTLTSYGADGNVATKEEAFSGHTRVTQYAYDTEGNLTKTTSPLGRVETLTYDAAGNITSRTTPKGEKWLYAFNALNEPTTTTAPDGTVVESRIYDGNGNVMSSTTSDGRTVTLTHDNNGLPTAATDAFGTTTFGYDANEQLVTQTDPAGGITRTSYDDAGRVSSIEDPAGHLTQFKRNALDQLVEVTAPDGSKQTAAYDAFGRLTALTDSAGRTTTYRYDAADQLVARVDRAGLTTTYGYDQDGNLSTVTYPDGDVATSVWDPVGRQVSLSDGDTIVDQTYDDANDLLAERSRGTGGVALPDVTLSYTTDANGNRTSVTGPGGVVNYVYDSRGRLSSVRDGAGRAFALTYDSSSNRLTGLARPNGVNDVLSYQGDVLTARDASSGAQVIGRADYVLDSLRQRTSLTDVDGAHTFTHDAAGQLTAAVHPAGSGLADESFQYDSTGNRTAWAGSPAATVGYDAGGRLQSDGTYDYTYDAEGRLLTPAQSRNRRRHPLRLERRRAACFRHGAERSGLELPLRRLRPARGGQRRRHDPALRLQRREPDCRLRRDELAADHVRDGDGFEQRVRDHPRRHAVLPAVRRSRQRHRAHRRQRRRGRPRAVQRVRSSDLERCRRRRLHVHWTAVRHRDGSRVRPCAVLRPDSRAVREPGSRPVGQPLRVRVQCAARVHGSDGSRGAHRANQGHVGAVSLGWLPALTSAEGREDPTGRSKGGPGCGRCCGDAAEDLGDPDQ